MIANRVLMRCWGVAMVGVATLLACSSASSAQPIETPTPSPPPATLPPPSPTPAATPTSRPLPTATAKPAPTPTPPRVRAVIPLPADFGRRRPVATPLPTPSNPPATPTPDGNVTAKLPLTLDSLRRPRDAARPNIADRAVATPAPRPIEPTAPRRRPAPSNDPVGDQMGMIDPSTAIDALPQTAPPSGTARRILEALASARAPFDALGEADRVYLHAELVLMRPPAAFEGADVNNAGGDVLTSERSILRAERHIGWDAADESLAAYIASDTGELWIQWFGDAGELLRIDADGLPLETRVQSLARVLTFPLNPYGGDVRLDAWWRPASQADRQRWRETNTYELLGIEPFLGEPCLVLGFDEFIDTPQGRSRVRGEEWISVDGGQLRRVRIYHSDAAVVAAAMQRADGPQLIAPNAAVQRDKVFQNYAEVAPGVSLPMQTIESIRSAESGEIISLLHLQVRQLRVGKPLPRWLMDEARVAPAE